MMQLDTQKALLCDYEHLLYDYKSSMSDWFADCKRDYKFPPEAVTEVNRPFIK